MNEWLPLDWYDCNQCCTHRRQRYSAWRLPEQLKPQRPPFNPKQWRRLLNRRWRTIQPQQPAELAFYWEKPHNRQLGRWRRRHY
jgi:hypothetical protein